jgi:hypothetical protein
MDLGVGAGPGANPNISGRFGYSDGDTDYLPGMRDTLRDEGGLPS